MRAALSGPTAWALSDYLLDIQTSAHWLGSIGE